MAIYDAGTASLAADGAVTGVGTTWRQPLTLIRVGATMIFNTTPASIVTIAEILSDTEIRVFNDKGFTAPAGTQYSILAHDGITVQGLAQDVAETLRHYQSRETEVAAAVDAFNNFDADAFQQSVDKVNTQSQQVSNDADQVAADKNQVSLDKDQSLNYMNYAEQYSLSASQSADRAESAASDATHLRTELRSSSGSSLIGFPSGGSLTDKIKYTRPEEFIEYTADVTAAIQAAFDSSKFVDMSNSNYTIERTINVRDGTAINLRGTRVTASLPDGAHLFSFAEAMQTGCVIEGGGGLINGSCESIFYFTGSTDDATQSSHYARNIRISNIYCSSDNIRYMIYMGRAVRQVFVNNCYAYVRRGVRAYGKIVETYWNNCIFFGSDSAVDTDARLHVDAILPARVPEGFHFTECLFDGPGRGAIINDMYVITVSGGYVGGDFIFGKPISLNHFISFTGCQCKGSIIFNPGGSENDYRASIKPAIMHSRGSSGSVIIESGSSGVSVDTKLVGSAAPGNLGVGVVVRSNTTNIDLRLNIDNTYERAAAFYGAGLRCTCEVLSYFGGSNPIYTERDLIIRNPLVTNATAFSQVSKFSNIPQSTYEVGSNFFSTTIDATRGATGVIRVAGVFSGLTPLTQRFELSVPEGLVIPAGSGWSSMYVYCANTQTNLSIEIPFYCTGDINSGVVSFKNASGTTATTSAHCWYGIFKS